MGGSDVTADVFRDVVSRFASGVTVVTAMHNGERFGMTASAVCSLSLDPPMVLVCVNRSAPTGDAVAASRAFAVNILGEDQTELAAQFALRHEDKFAGVATSIGALGCPLLDGALATLQCRLAQSVVGGTHNVLMGEVVAADALEGDPLTYFRGQFGQLQLGRDHPVASAVRERILRATEPSGSTLDADQLSRELAAGRAEIDRALAGLFAEGLIARAVDGTLVLAPIAAETLDQAFDARLAIELGAAELGIGRGTPAQLASLRREMERTAALIRDGHFVDVAGYARANGRFHDALVELAGSRQLLEAYRRLTLPGILVRALQDSSEADDALIADHRAIVAAYEAADLEAARAAIRVHTERTKATHRRALNARAQGQREAPRLA